MTTFKRPMLAAPLLKPIVPHTDDNILAALHKLHYPVWATIKKDGIRAERLKMGGKDNLLSRTLKPIPNLSIRERSLILPSGFDMELWNGTLSYDQIQSIVMRETHPLSDKIEFHILDSIRDGGYDRRQAYLHDWYFGMCSNDDASTWPRDIVVERPAVIHCADDLFAVFRDGEDRGDEGLCFRTPDSPYKQGRSTLKEQYLIKLCRYLRMEVTITGFVEQMENCNEDKWNAVGLMKRTSHQSNLFGKNTLGAFLVRDSKGREFSVGTGIGLTDTLRKHIWTNQAKYLGKQITIKYKPHGEKDLPRSPIYVGFREGDQ